MRPWALSWWAVVVVVALISRTSAAAGVVQKGPYLQHLSASSVDVRLELATALPVVVEVSTDGSVEAGPGQAPQSFASTRATFHSVHVAGLAPATRYRYVVRLGNDSIPGSFVTAPADDSHAPFTFVTYGDNRTDGPAHERVARAIGGERFDFLVHTGDFVNQGDEESAWQSFFDIEAPLLRDHALFACVGNHELYKDSEAAHFERYFGPAEPTATASPARALYGTFRWGRARFFLLNAFTDWVKGPERAWLDDVLNRTDHEAGIDLRIAVLHQGPYSAGPHGGDRALKDAHVDALFVKHHVDLVLAGHDHIYERGEAKSLKYIVTGGGGAPLYRDISPLASTRRVEATYNYVLTTVTDDGVDVIAKRPDGSIVETCSFARGGSWDCDAKPKPGTPPPLGPTVSATPPIPPPSKCGCEAVGTGTDPSRSGWFAALLLGGFVRRRRRQAGLAA